MSGLNHVFLVIEKKSNIRVGYSELTKADHVTIHDDSLRYFADSISWVSTYNPIKEEETNGLCWYGYTVITSENVEKLRSIISGWLLIFSEAPDIVELKGSWGWTEGDSPDSGSYEKLFFSKTELVEKLSKLVSYCDAVRASGGSQCLLHIGI